jgi:hypothetical protein
MSTKTRRLRPSPAIIVAIAALVAALAGTAVAANPDATTSALTKKKVKKIANKQIDKAAPGLSVASADVAENVMAATVPAGDSCTITSQTGGISAVLVGSGQTGVCDVTFPRSVEDCSVGATPLHPLQDIAGQASVRYLGGAEVRVTRRNGLDNFQAAGLFSIFAVCPGPDGL